MRFLAPLLVVTLLVLSSGCTDKVTGPSSTACLLGPYTFDSNPSVQRCRASNGQFANNECCGR